MDETRKYGPTQQEHVWSSVYDSGLAFDAISGARFEAHPVLFFGEARGLKIGVRPFIQLRKTNQEKHGKLKASNALRLKAQLQAELKAPLNRKWSCGLLVRRLAYLFGPNDARFESGRSYFSFFIFPFFRFIRGAARARFFSHAPKWQGFGPGLGPSIPSSHPWSR